MGYFSDFLVDNLSDDPSYPSPQQQLTWRLEDLQSRLAELDEQSAKGECRASFTADALRCILPAYLNSAAEVLAAIDLAVQDLAERYGVYAYGEPAEEAPEMDEITNMQISFQDILAMQSVGVQPLAA